MIHRKQWMAGVLVMTMGSVFAMAADEAKKPEEPVKLPEIAAGPFKPSDESLKQYKYPDWFRDAKFGIWAHWGPQAVPRHGDWYAKKMYQEGSGDYKYHVQHYGHPSKFGYKDIVALWKAEKWEPEKLMALYKKAGAKYFVSMGTHHDNFFLWNSKIHRWNAVNMGPKKDVVGIWQEAARKEGLRFGVSEHLGASFTWFQPSHGADKNGDMKGIPYDGADAQYQDLYHFPADKDDTGWLSKNTRWQQQWFAEIKELIDGYHPDLLYSDSAMPFGDVGRSMLAHLYNQDIAKNGGKLEAVYNCKQVSDGKWVRDIERGVNEEISPDPWQTDTSIGDWFYQTGQKYKTATEIIQMLTDIVSKNGNLLINVVQTPEGDLEADMVQALEAIAAWTAVNGEAIYGTRPWKVYGEGPTKPGKSHFGGLKDTAGYKPEDIRFTTKGETLYAICMGVPVADVKVLSLGKGSKYAAAPVSDVKLVGSDEKLEWKQEADALVIRKPAKLPCSHAVAFKIAFAAK